MHAVGARATDPVVCKLLVKIREEQKYPNRPVDSFTENYDLVAMPTNLQTPVAIATS